MTIGRFSDAELESFSIDPREPAGLARCPWCGQDIVLGVRKDTRNVSLVHAGHQDPTDPTNTRFVTGCEQFARVVRLPDVMQQLHNAGTRFQRLVPG
jgi:hypothetical protein